MGFRIESIVEATLKGLYREGVTHTLGGFQLLEEGLKNYIDLYYATASQLLQGQLHFGYERSDIQDAALGRLLTVFGKVSANQALLSEMRSLVKHRDQAAHQAFVCLYGPGPADQTLMVMTDANAKLMAQLSDLLPRLHAETLRVFAVMESTQKQGG